MTQFVKGFIGTNEGFEPSIRAAGNSGKDVYEVHLSAKDAEGAYENTTVSVWGKAIPVVQATVEKCLDKNLMIVFEGEYTDPYTNPKNDKVTYKFRAFDASPWFSSYPRK